MRTLVVLRPQPGAGRTLAQAARIGLETHHLPLFEVQPVAWSVPDLAPFDGVLFTSANALRHGGPHLPALSGLKAYAVGQATAAAARAAGFTVAAIGRGGVDQLLASVNRDRRLLHLCGEDRREPRAAPQVAASITVYRSIPLAVSAGLEQLIGAVALVHSPGAGRRLAELVADRSRTTVAAISRAAAEACGAGWERVEACSLPNDDALLSLAERLCKDSGPL